MSIIISESFWDVFNPLPTRLERSGGGLESRYNHLFYNELRGRFPSGFRDRIRQTLPNYGGNTKPFSQSFFSDHWLIHASRSAIACGVMVLSSPSGMSDTPDAFRLRMLVRGITSETPPASAKVTVVPVSAAITPVRERPSITSTLNATKRGSMAAFGSRMATRESAVGRPRYAANSGPSANPTPCNAWQAAQFLR